MAITESYRGVIIKFILIQCPLKPNRGGLKLKKYLYFTVFFVTRLKSSEPQHGISQWIFSKFRTVLHFYNLYIHMKFQDSFTIFTQASGFKNQIAWRCYSIKVVSVCLVLLVAYFIIFPFRLRILLSKVKVLQNKYLLHILTCKYRARQIAHTVTSVHTTWT